MKYNHQLLKFMLLLASSGPWMPLQAQSLWFRFTGGLEEAYNLSDVRKLTYGSEATPAVIVHLNDGNVVSYNYADVVSYYFSDSSVSIAERDVLNNNRLLVYPNPAGDMVTVSWLSTESGPFQIALRDLKGRLIESQLIANGGAGLRNHTLSLEHVPSGIFICQLIGNKSVQSTRLIKN